MVQASVKQQTSGMSLVKWRVEEVEAADGMDLMSMLSVRKTVGGRGGVGRLGAEAAVVGAEARLLGSARERVEAGSGREEGRGENGTVRLSVGTPQQEAQLRQVQLQHPRKWSRGKD